MEKDTIIAVLGAAVGLAGIVLIFMGFVSAQGENFQNNKRKEAFKRVAKFGLIPFSISLLSAWFCLAWLEGYNKNSYQLAIIGFKLSMISTLLYGIISVIRYL